MLKNWALDLTFDGDVCGLLIFEVLALLDAIAKGSFGVESARECDRGGKRPDGIGDARCAEVDWL